MSFVSALTSAILPVLSVAAVGYLLGRWREVDVGPLATVTIYVLTPALVFESLVTTPIGGRTVALLAVGVVAYTLAMAGIAEAVARGAEADPGLRGGFVLTSAFPNAGNYGIPLAAFAFGAVGRSTAVLYIAVQSVLMYTLGVSLAARDAAHSVRDSVVEVFRLPLVYAVVAAGAVRWLGVVPPTDGAAMETLELTGNAAIPVMLVLLGVQLSGIDPRGVARRAATPTVLRLAVAPAVAAGVAVAVGLDGTVGRVFVLEGATPAAVTSLLLSVEYADGDPTVPEFVSAVILVSTVASVLTLAAVLGVLQGGWLL